MLKKILMFSCALSMILSTSANAQDTKQAIRTSSKVIVNGTQINFDAYNIDDYNYFKLRDIAFVLNGTGSQFSVGWNENTNAINLKPGEQYEVSGGEMVVGSGNNIKTAFESSSSVFIDDSEIKLTAYNIDDNNYFKLRDLSSCIGFDVIWNEESQIVEIVSAKDTNNDSGNQTNEVIFDDLGLISYFYAAKPEYVGLYYIPENGNSNIKSVEILDVRVNGEKTEFEEKLSISNPDKNFVKDLYDFVDEKVIYSAIEIEGEFDKEDKNIDSEKTGYINRYLFEVDLKVTENDGSEKISTEAFEWLVDGFGGI